MWRARPDSVSVTIPTGIAEIGATWTPSTAEQRAAFEILVEISTRSVIVDLDDSEGGDREALNSIYALFENVRTSLKTAGPAVAQSKGDGSVSFATISLRMLNSLLRPFLDKWHHRLARHEARIPRDCAGFPTVSSGEWDRHWGGTEGQFHFAFRADLRDLRLRMRDYVFVYSRAANTARFGQQTITDSTTQTTLGPIYAPPETAISPDLGPVRNRMTRWFDPWSVLAMLPFFRAKDQRDASSNSGRREGKSEPDLELGDEHVWIDYVADMGDAFDPTMHIAWLLGRKHLVHRPVGADPTILRRGKLLVLGGDEIYPIATEERYQKQLRRPYEKAMSSPPVQAPMVVAVPGNHDWYGGKKGLGPWSAVFCEGKKFGEWQTVQSTSWWSVRLPHGWWMWGLDTALKGKLNDEQKNYFNSLDVRSGEQVILCTPVPLWRLRETKPERLHEIDTLMRSAVESKGAVARLYLAGDQHVFAAYERTRIDTGFEELHVTSGGGGAFLHPTHNLPLVVPHTPVEMPPGQSDERFEGGEFWPSPFITLDQVGSGIIRAVRDRQSILHYLASFTQRKPNFSATSYSQARPSILMLTRFVSLVRSYGQRNQPPRCWCCASY
jgi:Calcineurin-like phosphoesterase